MINRFFKRFFDILFSIVGLLLFSPIFLLFTILIPVTSKGGPFYISKRIGKNKKEIRLIKFRSMRVNSDKQGSLSVGDNDTRITKVGHFLRKSHIDEIPQFINVLFGQMSLVGPRPDLKYYTDMISENENRIFSVRPGMTDWASITNFQQYDAFSKAISPDDFYLKNIRPLKIRLQLYYIDNNNIFSDLQCLLWTFWKVLSRTKKLPHKIQVIVDEENKKMEASFDEK